MRIGARTYIHPTAVIFENVDIGTDCYIGPFCILGGPPEHADVDPFAPNKGIKIGNGCRLYGHNTIDAGWKEQTIIKDNCILMKGAHVGHDAIIYQHTTISCGAKVGGHSKISAFCNIGLNAVLHQFTDLPPGTMVGASAFVKGEHHEWWRILVGVPAKDIGENTRGKAKWHQ